MAANKQRIRKTSELPDSLDSGAPTDSTVNSSTVSIEDAQLRIQEDKQQRVDQFYAELQKLCDQYRVEIQLPAIQPEMRFVALD